MNASPILALLLLVAVVILLIVLFKYMQLQSRLNDFQSQFNDRVQQQFAVWRDHELESVKSQLHQSAQYEAHTALDRWRMESEANIRMDAIRRSSAVVSGKVTEHLAPYIGVFPYNPKDVRFLGAPVDLIVFDGMNEDDLREIVFLEVKTSSASLTTRERRIRDAVLAGKVGWREFRVG
jgi:predicted Holliday junction resolvase-like endonuclease